MLSNNISNIFQAVGCALNVFGFGESMAGFVVEDPLSDTHKWASRGFAIAAVLLLGTINVAGVKWVVKLQFLLLMIIMLAALDFFVGSFTTIPTDDKRECYYELLYAASLPSPPFFLFKKKKT